MHSSIANLPPAFHRLLPELAQLALPGEAASDCANCPVAHPEASDEDAVPRFLPDVRCCDHWPMLANFLVGRLLRGGGTGAELMRGRIHDGAAVSPRGVEAPPERLEALQNLGWRFGRSRELRCPYWVGGDHACGIWADRGAVCRTWFCKHDTGPSGWDLWQRVQELLLLTELKLRDWCVLVGDVPAEDADAETLIAWFLWCANRLDEATDAELATIRDEALTECLGRTRLAEAAQGIPLKPVMHLNVTATTSRGGRVTVEGYSSYDQVETGFGIFLFLSLLSDDKPWREALAEANSVMDEPLDEEVVTDLARIGALVDAHDPADYTYVVRDDGRRGQTE